MKNNFFLAAILCCATLFAFANEPVDLTPKSKDQSAISPIGYLSYDTNYLLDDDDYPRRRRRRRRGRNSGNQGMHWGIHFTPGLGSPGLPETDGIPMPTLPGFSFQLGADFYYFINDHVGFKSGLDYISLNASLDFVGLENSASVSAIGIPLNVVIKTHQTFGFLFDTGFEFMIPVGGKSEANGETNDDPDLVGFVAAYSFAVGGHFSVSDEISLSLAYSYNWTFGSMYKEPESDPDDIIDIPSILNPAYNWGIRIGMTMKLK